VKGYRLWCIDLHPPKFIISRDVKFNESTMLHSSKEDRDAEKEDNINKQVEFEVNSPHKIDTDTSKQPVQEEAQESVDQLDEAPLAQYNLARDKTRRQSKPPQRYAQADVVSFALSVAEDIEAQDPVTYREAITSSESSQWIGAMNEELASLYNNHTWELVKPPKSQKVIGCKWVFKKKDGSPRVDANRYKACLVAKGFSQREGIDFNKVFSPVVKHSSIWVLLVIVALFDLELEQLDVKTTFLHGDLEEQIYMKQLEGFVVEGKEDHACLLKKSLYGLKQSPRQWCKRFDSFMIDHNYSRSNYDSCVYHKKLQDGTFVYLLLYVDDMLIASKSIFEINKLKTMLNNEFEMKNLGAAKKILGMEINRDRSVGKLYLSQKNIY